MGLRLASARAVGAAATWALRRLMHRHASTLPGKLALSMDPGFLMHMRPRLACGCVMVAGTNGKTTVTNLLADAFEAHGLNIACNRAGANLKTGVATALLQAGDADWGVFEIDELWLAQVLPQLRPSCVVLLNFFRDQLDRMGEIALVQRSIADALAAHPQTALIYNADDPLCQAVADSVRKAGVNAIAFGLAKDTSHEPRREDLDGPCQSGMPTASTQMCPNCDTLLRYEWRHYAQLGSYACPACGFARGDLSYEGYGVHESESGIQLGVRALGQARADASQSPLGDVRISAPLAGMYSAYNLLAACAVANWCGVPLDAVRVAASALKPDNGRQQSYVIDGMRVLLNLAKNPAGFDQNIRIIRQDVRQSVAGFFVNDNVVDGRDVSWLWDARFEELADAAGLRVYAGGTRAHDVQVRLKYAGVKAGLAQDADALLDQARGLSSNSHVYLVANYTALPHVKEQLDRMVTTSRTVHVGTDDAAGFVGGYGAGAAGRTASGRENSESADVPADPDGMTDARVVERDPGAWETKESTKGLADPCRVSNVQVVERGAGAIGGATMQASHGELVIAHLYPELLNLYGDGGNVRVLLSRACWRGVDARVVRAGCATTDGDGVCGAVGLEEALAVADIAFLGGGPDREQRMACHDLLRHARSLRDYIQDDGVLLAICGGYQILGREWLLGDETVAGAGVIDVTTTRAAGGAHDRLVGNVVLDSPLACLPDVGYENHAGRTRLLDGAEPFGRVMDGRGFGNDDESGADGVLYRNVVGTYLHGPLLSKNPEVADWLIARALQRRARLRGCPAPILAPLDDSVERAANAAMLDRMGVGKR